MFGGVAKALYLNRIKMKRITKLTLILLVSQFASAQSISNILTSVKHKIIIPPIQEEPSQEARSIPSSAPFDDAVENLIDKNGKLSFSTND